MTLFFLPVISWTTYLGTRRRRVKVEKTCRCLLIRWCSNRKKERSYLSMMGGKAFRIRRFCVDAITRRKQLRRWSKNDVIFRSSPCNSSFSSCNDGLNLCYTMHICSNLVNVKTLLDGSEENKKKNGFLVIVQQFFFSSEFVHGSLTPFLWLPGWNRDAKCRHIVALLPNVS